jgi:uncharacterized repeat protein (TIGR02543 family)
VSGQAWASNSTGAGSIVISYPAAYTVSFDANSGTGSPSVASVAQASAGASVTLATVNTLARTGYSFSGWNTAANGTGTTYAAGASYTPAAAITMYAQWNSTITFDSNTATSGTVPTATTAKSSAAVTTLATNTGTLAKSNYTFAGWNTLANGTGTSYAAGLTTYASDGNRTLYAQWNSLITYDSNTATSGTVPASSSISSSVGSPTALATNSGTLAKTNYTFDGWNTQANGLGTSYAISATTYPNTGNAKLYAKWSSYITYNGNTPTTGSAPAAQTITPLGGNLATNSGSLTKTNLVFAGWNTNSGGTGTWYAAGASYPNLGNLTLYAQWVSPLAIAGSTSIIVSSGINYRSDTYTASAGLDTKTVVYQLSPINAGITLETSSVTSTSTLAFIKIANNVPAGTYIDTLTASDKTGLTITKAVTIQVIDPVRWSASNSSSVTTPLGVSASLRLDMTGGTTGKTFTMIAGSVATSAAITLDTSTANANYVTLNLSTSVLSGSYIESITVRDIGGSSALILITVNVTPALTISSGASSTGATYTSAILGGVSGSYIQLPASSIWQIGANYTIEWWQYETDANTYPYLFMNSTGQWGVTFQGGLFYYFSGSPRSLGSVTVLKNQWVHYAIVSNNNSQTAYQNGKALGPAVSGVSITSTQVPSTSPIYIGTYSPTIATTYAFGGNITNFQVSKSIKYAGTSTTTPNFTPTTAMPIDAYSVVALTGLNSAALLSDYGPNSVVPVNYGSVTGSSMYPSAAGPTNLSFATTQGTAVTSPLITAAGGSGTKTFTLSPTVSGMTISSPSANNAYINLDNTLTATNSTTAATYLETVTATDAVGASVRLPVSIVINPSIALTATTLNLTTSFGVAITDTVSATQGTGNKTFTLSSSPSSAGITLSNSTTNQAVLSVGKNVSAGTYYETITATDSATATSNIVITIVVAQGVSLVPLNSVTSLTTTFGRSASLRIDAVDGITPMRFSLTQIGTSNSGITLDTSTASSRYATLNIGATVPAGSYTDSITVTDGVGGTFSVTISVLVNPAPVITKDSLTSGTVAVTATAGRALTSTAFTAASGTGAKTFTISPSVSGITLDTATANTAYLKLDTSLTNSDSVTVRTIYETVTATDSSGATVTRALVITLNPAVVITPAMTTVNTTSGVAATDTITATQGTGSKSFALAGSPSAPGITLSNSAANPTLLNIGTTVSPGTYYESITATDSLGATTIRVVAVNVAQAPTISGNVSLSSTAGYGFTSPSYTSANGTGAHTFTIAVSPAAGGITVVNGSSGVFTIAISSAVAQGSYTATVTARDSVGGTGTFAIAITVNAPVTLTGNKTLTKTYGVPLSQIYQTNSGTQPFTFFTSTVCTSIKTTVNGQTIEQFTGTGTCNWAVPNGVTSARILVVGGGASGDRGVCNQYWGHGGGGGEVIDSTTSLTAGASISISVGGGGAATGGCTAASNGNNGTQSYFGSIVARPGRGATASGVVGGTSGSGFVGGTGTGTFPAGAGGGAGGVGINLAGGPGINSDITGTTVMYGSGGAGKNDAGAGTAYSGGGTSTAFPTPNRGGGGSDYTGWSVSSPGASGVVIVSYLTPTAAASTSILTMTTLSTSSPGSIQLDSPAEMSVNTYVQTITVTDSTGSTGSTPVTVTLTITKATPAIGLALPGGVTSTPYGSPVTISATTATPGTVNFLKRGISISNCSSIATSANVANCSWTPTALGSETITATITPTDSVNYNSNTSLNFIVTVVQADTLTVTASDEAFIYTGSAISATKSYTLNGLTSIDSVTAMSYSFTGSANDSTSYSSATTAPTKAGTYAITPTGLTFAVGASGNYRAIVYNAGAITVNRAQNVLSFNYGTSNVITYGVAKTETVTSSSLGEAIRSYATTSSIFCSVDSNSGTITTLRAGNCDVSMSIPQGYNYLGDTFTASVSIGKASRTFTIVPALASLQYGDTTTVTSTISAGDTDGNISYSTGDTYGCIYDPLTGVLTAISGTLTCSLTGTIAAGTNYRSAVSASVAITLSKAPAPVVTTNTVLPVSYTGSPVVVSPTYSISGLRLTDIASAVTYIYSATSPTYYSDTATPTLGGNYLISPSALVLSSGSLSNYLTPTYVGYSWAINRIDQNPITITNNISEAETPFQVRVAGGTVNGAISITVVAGGTATGCAVSSSTILNATSAGTCIIYATMAGDRNYLDVNSETLTVTVLKFTPIVAAPAENSNTGITIGSSTPLTITSVTCTSGCVPTITATSVATANAGDSIVITGTNFTGATQIIFARRTYVTVFTVVDDSHIQVTVPSGIAAGSQGVAVEGPGGLSSRFMDFAVSALSVT